MITAVRYMPILISSVVMMASVLFKILLMDELVITDLFRDIALFFILYFVVKSLATYMEKMFKNYWKIL